MSLSHATVDYLNDGHHRHWSLNLSIKDRFCVLFYFLYNYTIYQYHVFSHFIKGLCWSLPQVHLVVWTCNPSIHHTRFVPLFFPFYSTLYVSQPSQMSLDFLLELPINFHYCGHFYFYHFLYLHRSILPCHFNQIYFHLSFFGDKHSAPYNKAHLNLVLQKCPFNQNATQQSHNNQYSLSYFSTLGWSYLFSQLKPFVCSILDPRYHNLLRFGTKLFSTFTSLSSLSYPLDYTSHVFCLWSANYQFIWLESLSLKL